jgi:hypothetical protein
MHQGDRMSEQQNDTGPEEHPRGTLAVVGLFGVVFLLGWLAFYFFVFAPRGLITR